MFVTFVKVTNKLFFPNKNSIDFLVFDHRTFEKAG